MAKKSAPSAISLRGVRHNNLKNFDLDLPLNRLIVITGLSGSGKSSLAFDTLFAEGQRRYIETFSPYARQFFDRMDKPRVDRIDGIPPAIAIEQRNSVKSTRSTVGTMTEICDYMKVLWPQIATLHCRQCDRPVRKDSPRQIWDTVTGNATDTGAPAAELVITFSVPISEKLSLDDSLALVAKQGYQRLLLNGEMVRMDDATPHLRKNPPSALTIIQDRLKPAANLRGRFVEACEQAFHFGRGKLAVCAVDTAKPGFVANPPRLFSNFLHCAYCDLDYRDPSSALFSFNHPVGACPNCKGFGRVITIDYNLALPDRSLSLTDGAVKPWRTGTGAESQADMLKFCRIRKIPVNVPFRDLPQKTQDWVIDGDPGYGTDEKHKWPRAWYGIKGYFRWLESKAYKMHVRVLLSRYRAYSPCPTCHGKRLQPEALLYRVDVNGQISKRTGSEAPLPRPARNEWGEGRGAGQPLKTQEIQAPNPLFDPSPPSPHSMGRGQGEGNASGSLTLSDFYRLPIRQAAAFVAELAERYQPKASDPLGLVLNEVRSRLGFLHDVGLGYLTLDRSTRSLSGGETERVNLTTCLGTRLVNTLFVLDEPSVGLHPRDTTRLVRILEKLRDAGNTVIVVEHEAGVMRAADQIVDIGPGHGAEGGHIVFQGTYSEILKSPPSLTGQYLSGRRRIEIPARRPVNLKPGGTPKLTLAHASLHNLKNLTVEIPLNRLVAISGVSGSGKTTLAREILLPLLEGKLNQSAPAPTAAEDADEEEAEVSAQPAATLDIPKLVSRVVLVDQSSLSKTPRSNPAVYTGAFDPIREWFAQSPAASQSGLGASAFSFNSKQGQCEHCRGAGFEKIEMQFLSDIFIRCPECDGRRYRPHILEIKIASPVNGQAMSIGDFLDATVDEALAFLAQFPDSRPAQRAATSVKYLQDVGLGYLRLGQPINTLSGGESQRLKLVRHLADFAAAAVADTGSTIFLFDEPTTGLHFDDVRLLVGVFQQLVDAGHSVLVIEHNLDVIKSADWVIDLGPDAGDEGGQIVAQGPPEQVAACAESHTGSALADVLVKRR